MPPFPPIKDKTNLISNILAIVGFIIVAVIVIWGLLSLAGLAKPFWASITKRAAGSIKVTAPTSPVERGEPLTVSWKYDAKVPGAYAFLYQCREGFRFRTTGTEKSPTSIPCGEAFTISGETKSISITPITADAATTTVPISIVFTPTSTSTAGQRGATGSAMITVKGAKAPTAEVETTPLPGTPAASAGKKEGDLPTGQAGIPDLSVKILSIGVIDPITGDIAPRRPTSPNDLVIVRFDIANEGAASTGTWYFTAQIPSEPPFTYNSPPQASLAPKDHIENMLRFKQVPPGGGTFSVYADHLNLIREPNEVNNYVNQNI